MKLTGKTQETVNKEKAEAENLATIQALTTYLFNTDWYVVRYSETLVPIPEEILQKRQEARDTISQLRDI